MQNDEQEIRQVIANWMSATRAGDVDAVLDLMTDDVVFLVPGQAPFGKAAFAAAMRTQSDTRMQLDGNSELREVRVLGDWAFAWTRLTVTATTPGEPPVVRAGHTLSVFRKQAGKWRLARDANLLATVDAPAHAGGAHQAGVSSV
jgi:uncharacterized protein (TIGR02246 family)